MKKSKENIYEALKNDGRFTILTKMLDETGLGEAMSEEQIAFTFFAPTDEAFCRLSEKALDVLSGSDGLGVFAAIIGQNLIPESYLKSKDLRNTDSVKTLYGHNLKIKKRSDTLQLEEAKILMPGIETSNAIVFPIDNVLPARNKSVQAKKGQ